MAKVEVVVKKTAPHQFRAATVFRGGWVVGSIAGQRRTAVQALEAELREKGFLGEFPQWAVRDWAPKPPPPASPLSTVPANGPAAVAAVSAQPIAKTETVPAPEPEPYQPPACPAAATDKGWVTPLSDLVAWLATANLAVNQVVALGYTVDPSTMAKFRQDVNVLMESVGAVGAYRPRPNGEPWHARTGFQDISLRSVRRGDGDRREFARQVSVGEREAPRPKAAKYEYLAATAEQKKLACNAGKEASRATGKPRFDASAMLAYKTGYLASLAAQGLPPHEKFAADVAAAAAQKAA